MDWLQTLNETPMPTILVIAGLLFVFLAISGGVSGKVFVPEKRQTPSAVAGALLIVLGLGIYLVPSSNNDHQTPNLTESNEQEDQAAKPKIKDLEDNLDAEPELEPEIADWPVRYWPDYFRNHSRWPQEAKDRGTYAYRKAFNDGKASLEIVDKDNGAWLMSTVPLDPLLDFELEAEFTWKKTGSENDCLGISFRNRGNYFYLYHFCRNGKATFYDYSKNRDPVWKNYQSINTFSLNTQVNKLKVRCEGKTMLFYVNDRLLINQTDGGPKAGSIKLYLEADDKSTAAIEIDNIQVKLPQD